MFEWDESKSEANFLSRGFDFAYASLIFEGPTLEKDDLRAAYGERRIQAVGRVGEDFLFVVYTWRSGVRRIISARPASRRERDGYCQIYGGGSEGQGPSEPEPA
ncbi:MAG: BrnT family toxin [Alphaproteobacteria bacterium]|nr:BrnT family toxin [Alphaproteobacteria bacterium]